MTLLADKPSIINVLNVSHLPLVSFDPENPQHRNAYRKFLVSGKQDVSLRFRLEGDFSNVPEMMKQRMAVAGLRALDTLALLAAVEQSPEPLPHTRDRPMFASVNN